MSLLARFTTRNVGTLDRVLSFVPSLLVLVLWQLDVLSGTLLTIAVVFAVMMALRGLTARCSFYALFGLSTCKS